MIMDFEKNGFHAPRKRLDDISSLVRQPLVRASTNKRWVPVKSLPLLEEKTHFLHLAISVARFYLRELHDIVISAASCSGTLTNKSND